MSATIEVADASTLAQSYFAEDRILLEIQRPQQILVWNVPNVIWEQSAKSIASVIESGKVGP